MKRLAHGNAIVGSGAPGSPDVAIVPHPCCAYTHTLFPTHSACSHSLTLLNEDALEG